MLSSKRPWWILCFEGNEIHGLDQNHHTKSRWAQLAPSGKKVMQFLSEGRFMANVVDGKATPYAGRGGTSRRGELMAQCLAHWLGSIGFHCSSRGASRWASTAELVSGG
jgi:hypothetical protein